MAAPEVTLQINVEGLEQAKAAMDALGVKAGEVSVNVGKSTQHMEVSHRRLGLAMASTIANSVQLGDIMHRMATGQLDVSRGTLLLAMNFIQLSVALERLTHATWLQAAAEWAHNLALKEKLVVLAGTVAGYAMYYSQLIASTIAEWAHIAALHAKAIALAIVNALSGPWGWAILGGAVAAAAVGIALAASIPSKQFGGPIEHTGPYLLHAGEYVMPRGAPNILNFNFYGAASPRDADNVIDALRRAGVV